MKILSTSFLVAGFMAVSIFVQPANASDVNPNLEKMNKMFEMLRAQGRLPSQTVDVAPPDSYTGDDAEKLKKIAREDYAKNYPGEEVIDVRIQMDGWERRNEERWHEINKAYYKVDISTIQALVFVKKDGQSAYIFPFDFTKDHTNNDDLTWDGKSSRVVNALVQEVPLSKM